jgi:signal transduction histidine kinase
MCASPGYAPGQFTVTSDIAKEAGRAERRRIAQDLHDTLLQGFLAVSMQLHAAMERLSGNCAAKQQLGGVTKLLDDVLDQGRRAVQGLRTHDEDPGSLAEAFARVPNEAGFPAARIRVVVQGHERELKAELRQEVYRIGREAIVNACRHSQARSIEMEVEYRPAELRISVLDNGCGIDPQLMQWGRTGHWGLQGMRERAEQIGARLRLCSSVAVGTEIELRVPARIAFHHAFRHDGGGLVS